MRALREFHCLKCNFVYEEFCNYDEAGLYPDVECPECHSQKKENLIGAPKFSFVNPVGTRSWNNEQKGHDYRFKYMQPRVQKEREYAEQKSHMGKDVYIHHDDVSSGKHFDSDKW